MFVKDASFGYLGGKRVSRNGAAKRPHVVVEAYIRTEM